MTNLEKVPDGQQHIPTKDDVYATHDQMMKDTYQNSQSKLDMKKASSALDLMEK